MNDLKQYDVAVKNLASKGENFNFPNADPKHATIVTSTILNNSQEVRFYIKDLDGSIADNILTDVGETRPRFIDSLSYFLAMGREIKIVIENETDFDSKFYDLLKESSVSKEFSLDIRIASPEFKKNISKGFKFDSPSSTDFYFMVGDKKSYRINFNRELGKAVCNFNNPTIAVRLSDNFDNNFPNCSKFSFK